MDIFPIFYILNFAIWKIPEIYQIRAQEIEPPRKSRELAKIASEPHSAFRWAPSQVLGGLGAKMGVLWGKIGFFINFWGWA